MRRDLTLLTGRVHDLLVIGGGIHGACVAWDAALRGLAVALVERDELLGEAEVLVSPRLKGLNTPMTIYSYLDSGTAVLATKLRTHTQVLDERTALLVDPEPVALGDGLATLLANPSLRRRLAREAKEYVQREFTPEAAGRKLDAFYASIESLAAGGRGCRPQSRLGGR